MDVGEYSIRRVLKFDEAKAVSGIGRTKLFELARNGDLETVLIGRRRYILKASLERLLTPRAA